MNVLIVEDDEQLSALLCEFVDKKVGGAICAHAKSISDGLKSFDDAALVILDLLLADSNDPVATLEAFKVKMAEKPVIVVSGVDDLSHGLKAMELGAVDFVAKPFDLTRIGVALDLALKRYEKGDS